MAPYVAELLGHLDAVGPLALVDDLHPSRDLRRHLVVETLEEAMPGLEHTPQSRRVFLLPVRIRLLVVFVEPRSEVDVLFADDIDPPLVGRADPSARRHDDHSMTIGDGGLEGAGAVEAGSVVQNAIRDGLERCGVIGTEGELNVGR